MQIIVLPISLRQVRPQPAPPPAVASPDLAAAERATVDNLRATREQFARLGVTEREGNGAFKVVMEPDMGEGHYHNASYMRGYDMMLVGHVPQGRSYGFAKDVIAHEASHRVIDKIANLCNFGESGVVGESLADTFAASVDTDDWKIGEDVHPGGMRDMLDPKSVPNDLGIAPDHLREKVRTLMDKGGVHINIGIPNKAAALVGEQLGRDRMAQIYLNALRNHLPGRPVIEGPLGETNYTNIAGLAQATIESARELGSGRDERAVRDAWKAVGFDDPTIRSGLQHLPEMASATEQVIASLEQSHAGHRHQARSALN